MRIPLCFQVGAVLNYDMPQFVSDYIHRCGRVGRVGSRYSQPRVTSLVTKPYEVELVRVIEVINIIYLHINNIYRFKATNYKS